jgi:hypothetical protein
MAESFGNNPSYSHWSRIGSGRSNLVRATLARITLLKTFVNRRSWYFHGSFLDVSFMKMPAPSVHETPTKLQGETFGNFLFVKVPSTIGLHPFVTWFHHLRWLTKDDAPTGALPVRSVISTTSELRRKCSIANLVPDGDHAKDVSESGIGSIKRCGAEPSIG